MKDRSFNYLNRKKECDELEMKDKLCIKNIQNFYKNDK